MNEWNVRRYFLGFLEKVLPPKSPEKLSELSLLFPLVTICHNYEAWNCCSHLATILKAKPFAQRRMEPGEFQGDRVIQNPT